MVKLRKIKDLSLLERCVITSLIRDPWPYGLSEEDVKEMAGVCYPTLLELKLGRPLAPGEAAHANLQFKRGRKRRLETSTAWRRRNPDKVRASERKRSGTSWHPLTYDELVKQRLEEEDREGRTWG
jgi:hypothetical protein